VVAVAAAVRELEQGVMQRRPLEAALPPMLVALVLRKAL
jgi:hypothetical protein